MVTDVPAGPDIGENEEMVGGEIQENPGSDAEPPVFVTVTFPVAPVLTTADIDVDECTVKDDTGIPPTVTDVIPVSEEPAIFRIVPKVPLVGVKEVIEGKAMYPGAVVVPPGVVTDINPEAPEGTIAVIVEGDTTTNEVAAIPPKLTAEAELKFVPEIVTEVPAVASVGENEVMVGGGKKVNPASVPIPVGVFTVTLPDAPLPTTAVIVVEDCTMKEVA